MGIDGIEELINVFEEAKYICLACLRNRHEYCRALTCTCSDNRHHNDENTKENN